jgi:hypothetical protein
MRTTIADPQWNHLLKEDLLADETSDFDRVPGLPLVGFISGTLISLGLWTVISLIVLRLF